MSVGVEMYDELGVNDEIGANGVSKVESVLFELVVHELHAEDVPYVSNLLDLLSMATRTNEVRIWFS